MSDIVSGIATKMQIKNAAGAVINPATEETLAGLSTAFGTGGGTPYSNTITGLSIGSTNTIVTYTAAAAGRFWGYTATGTRDGVYFITINGTNYYHLRGNAGNGSNASLALPIGHLVQIGDVVSLKVTNEGQGPGNYNGTVFIQ